MLANIGLMGLTLGWDAKRWAGGWSPSWPSTPPTLSSIASTSTTFTTTTTLVATQSANPIVDSGTVTLTATVKNTVTGAAVTTGQVKFSAGTTVLGTDTTSPWTWPSTAITAATTYKAEYLGYGDALPSSDDASVSVSKSTTTVFNATSSGSYNRVSGSWRSTDDHVYQGSSSNNWAGHVLYNLAAVRNKTIISATFKIEWYEYGDPGQDQEIFLSTTEKTALSGATDINGEYVKIGTFTAQPQTLTLTIPSSFFAKLRGTATGLVLATPTAPASVYADYFKARGKSLNSAVGQLTIKYY